MISGFKSPHFTVSTKACFPMQNFMPLRAKLHENRIILPETIPFFGIICIWSPPTPSFMQIGFEIMGFRVYIANFALTSVIGGQLPGSSSTPFLRRPIPRFFIQISLRMMVFFQDKTPFPRLKNISVFWFIFFSLFCLDPTKNVPYKEAIRFPVLHWQPRIILHFAGSIRSIKADQTAGKLNTVRPGFSLQ